MVMDFNSDSLLGEIEDYLENIPSNKNSSTDNLKANNNSNNMTAATKAALGEHVRSHLGSSGNGGIAAEKRKLDNSDNAAMYGFHSEPKSQRLNSMDDNLGSFLNGSEGGQKNLSNDVDFGGGVGAGNGPGPGKAQGILAQALMDNRRNIKSSLASTTYDRINQIQQQQQQQQPNFDPSNEDRLALRKIQEIVQNPRLDSQTRTAEVNRIMKENPNVRKLMEKIRLNKNKAAAANRGNTSKTGNINGTLNPGFSSGSGGFDEASGSFIGDYSNSNFGNNNPGFMESDIEQFPIVPQQQAPQNWEYNNKMQQVRPPPSYQQHQHPHPNDSAMFHEQNNGWQDMGSTQRGGNMMHSQYSMTRGPTSYQQFSPGDGGMQMRMMQQHPQQNGYHPMSTQGDFGMRPNGMVPVSMCSPGNMVRRMPPHPMNEFNHHSPRVMSPANYPGPGVMQQGTQQPGSPMMMKGYQDPYSLPSGQIPVGMSSPVRHPTTNRGAPMPLNANGPNNMPKMSLPSNGFSSEFGFQHQQQRPIQTQQQMSFQEQQQVFASNGTEGNLNRMNGGITMSMNNSNGKFPNQSKAQSQDDGKFNELYKDFEEVEQQQNEQVSWKTTQEGIAFREKLKQRLLDNIRAQNDPQLLQEAIKLEEESFQFSFSQDEYSLTVVQWLAGIFRRFDEASSQQQQQKNINSEETNITSPPMQGPGDYPGVSNKREIGNTDYVGEPLSANPASASTPPPPYPPRSNSAPGLEQQNPILSKLLPPVKPFSPNARNNEKGVQDGQGFDSGENGSSVHTSGTSSSPMSSYDNSSVGHTLNMPSASSSQDAVSSEANSSISSFSTTSTSGTTSLMNSNMESFQSPTHHTFPEPKSPQQQQSRGSRRASGKAQPGGNTNNPYSVDSGFGSPRSNTSTSMCSPKLNQGTSPILVHANGEQNSPEK